MSELVESMGAAEVALKIERLQREIQRLEAQVEVEEYRSDYFEGQYRHLSKLMKHMDDMIQTSVVIECSEVWEIALETWWADGKKTDRRVYEGDTFQAAMEAMVAGENRKKEAK